jgi:predicted dehydrogenase
MTRIGVVGAGPMGRLHARAVRRLADRGLPCELTLVIDRHLGRAETLASEFGGSAASDSSALTSRVDAVVVAVPASAHFELARVLLDEGLDLFIEKPLAESVVAGEQLVRAAQAAGRVLQVGHIEWYNACLHRAAALAGVPQRIEVDRLHPPTGRGRDIDVVQDLMLHDLDWTTRLIGEPVTSVEASGRKVDGDRLDQAEARLGFESGCRVVLRASRVDSVRRRHVRIEGTHAVVELDLLSGRIESDGQLVQAAPVDAAGDPIELQWLDFLQAVEKREDPVNDGRVGVAALRLVDRVRDAIVFEAGSAGLDDDTRFRG